MEEQAQEVIRKAYAEIARGGTGCGCGSSGPGGDSTLCSSSAGYTDSQLVAGPGEANLGLGCGNPTAIAGLRRGDTVLDLGSGAGFDCFLAAQQVGETGRVIGVDMTPEMVAKARSIARRRNVLNVEFRLGEIENLPVADGIVDVVISNCVINLVADKLRAFREAFRVLKRGGRLAVSDTALRGQLPESLRSSANARVACIAGAIPVEQYAPMVEQAGFEDVSVTIKSTSGCISTGTADPIGRTVAIEYGSKLELNELVASVYVQGVKK